MVLLAIAVLKGDSLLAPSLIIAVGAGFSFAFLLTGYWMRRRQRIRQRQLLKAMVRQADNTEDLILVGNDATAHGELVAQFRVNKGKRVLSVLEADGKRFIHVDGAISEGERARMVRYLKSEGFMS